MKPLFAKNDHVENGIDSGDDDKEMGICLKLTQFITHALRSCSLFSSKIYVHFLLKLLELLV